jgi:hypothetical protein
MLRITILNWSPPLTECQFPFKKPIWCLIKLPQNLFPGTAAMLSHVTNRKLQFANIRVPAHSNLVTSPRGLLLAAWVAMRPQEALQGAVNTCQ